jgi:hypothetical protein
LTIHQKLGLLFIKKFEMEQKDYLLREIEKIGLVLRAILGNLFNKSENLAIRIHNDFEKTNEQLLNEIGFNLKYFLTLDDSAINEYLAKFNGLKTANLELLAELIFFFGENENSDTKRVFLEKALQLYELCKRTDKTYSFDREKKINIIKNAL